MVDLDCKAKMISPNMPNMPNKSTKLSTKIHISIPPTASFPPVTNRSPVAASDSACSAYEQYLRIPELSKIWSFRQFSGWENESILKPALQALEITFRLVSTVLSDPRPYVNQREWKRRLESLAASQVELIAMMCDEEEENGETRGNAPIADLSSSTGVLARDGSFAEVWKAPGDSVVVNRTSEASLLPRLATWQKSEDIAQKILYSIECELRRCPYTLGLGEPNLTGKPNLEYDAVCRPNELHALKKSPYDLDNHENQTLYTTHQIFESWIYTAQELIKRIVSRIESKKFDQASSHCYLLARIWKFLEEIQDLHLLMDPDDFLKLKNQLSIKSVDETEAFCFRSRGLVEITKACRDLKHKVPEILGVEVDPKGGPRVQEAAMRLYGDKRDADKIHLLQALQGIEAALKRFFYAYKQVLVVVMGSLEAKGNKIFTSSDSCDSLSQIFLEPTCYPSLDAAKTFLGEFWGARVTRE
ncbi:nematode resistance protein-like HSPRO2 [Tripterygium wilfordii]|uniref:Nematode resistance protein-like HSPRO2 n=1 Tax=Tripterygium wilfordii TaxID=458696 RepID=A0A7J7CWM0_TRIWF|nr:nematode resistance protein-like HSPRO2 [Tripterygium wilfordii]KAF5738463.1 nematode resistance protein-like HSPRO2 [Tripterygium wilfordii]